MASTTKRNVEVVQYGITELVSDENPAVDIVFVHGLNGSAYNTWTTKKSPEVYWPSDLLPKTLSGLQVRILTYGYNANVTAFMDGTSTDKLHNHSEHLVANLFANRNNNKAVERPIVFVAHSLGGLVVKKALSHSNTQPLGNEHLRSIYVSTYGILFLGTPHNGSDIAKWGGMLQSICSAVLPKKMFDSSPQLIQSLRTDNEHLQTINRDFVSMIDKFRVYFFHESRPMDLKGTRAFVVDESSAAPILGGVGGVERSGIEADHGAMCRFENAKSPGYEVVSEAIRRYSSDAPLYISRVWMQEHKEREMERMGKAMLLYAGTANSAGGSVISLPTIGLDPLETSLSSLPGPNSVVPLNLNTWQSEDLHQAKEKTELIMITPPGFHPNGVFFGMQDELKKLKSLLIESERRFTGSAAVLIHAGPGAGKSHLARQYMYDNLSLYPGGVFWIDGRTNESRLNGIWEIAVSASMLADEQLSRDPKWFGADIYPANVKKWLEGRENWLLIFDGLVFGSDEDLNEFRDYLPFKKNTSIIFTSIDRTLSQKQRLFEPYGIHVKPLSVSDARKLLFHAMGIERPTSQQRRKATEVVKYYECLPLAMHALGHRLHATSKPLEKYHVESYLTDRRLAEPYQGIMADLHSNGHIEALSLVNILSFFGHHVPVGMIHLGRKALADYQVEIRTLEREGSTQRHIDNTFGVLIKYGLIERSFDPYPLNETTATPTSDLESKDHHSAPETPNSNLSGSQETYPSSIRSAIDIIKIHTVVQGFCRDELRGQDPELYCLWLSVATDLFCLSYGNATTQIKATRGSGLSRDYREYRTHARSLMHHFPKELTEMAMTLRPCYERLASVIEDVQDEIQNQSPESSQESFRNQKSIFDHTSSLSSFSDSGGSGSTAWHELDMEPMVTDSPLDVDHTQRLGLLEWNRQHNQVNKTKQCDDDENRTVHMSPSLSQDTEVPTPKVNQAENEKPPASPKKNQQKGKSRGFLSFFSRRHNEPNDFKPPTSSISVSVSDVHVGRQGSPGPDHFRTKSISTKSDAETALAAMHRSSPPPSRGSGAKVFNRGSLLKENERTYADVLSGQSPIEGRSNPARGGHGRRASLNLSAEDTLDKLGMSTHSDPGLPYPSSPQRDPNLESFQMPGAPLHSRPGPGEFPRGGVNREVDMPEAPYGPNLLPLPFQTDVEITQMPRRTAPSNNHRMARDSFNPGYGTLYPNLSSRGSSQSRGRGTGYSSQPMSRDNSQLSRESDPGRYPPKFSPKVGGDSRAASFSHIGRQFAPVLDTQAGQRVLFGPGGSAIDSSSTTPVSYEAPPLAKTSSGPGIMVESRNGMSRSLIEFDRLPYTQHLQFGGLDPVDVDAARIRSGQTPYPNQNLMPTASDPVQLDALLNQTRVDELRIRENAFYRGRGVSSPPRPDLDGLGIRRQR